METPKLEGKWVVRVNFATLAKPQLEFRTAQGQLTTHVLTGRGLHKSRVALCGEHSIQRRPSASGRAPPAHPYVTTLSSCCICSTGRYCRLHSPASICNCHSISMAATLYLLCKEKGILDAFNWLETFIQYFKKIIYKSTLNFTSKFQEGCQFFLLG